MIRVFLFLISFSTASALLSSCATFTNLFSTKTRKLSLTETKFPNRPSGALSGSAFIHLTRNYSSEQRERAILNEIFIGNIPSFLRQLKPVKLVHRYQGRVYEGYVYVTPDYLAIGSDNDFVRIPMTPITAQKIADKFGFVLPTRKLVNDIYNQSEIKLSPRPLPPGRMMTSNSYYDSHNRMIESQLRDKNRTKLVAGHKKDLVITNQLIARPSRVAIYGWHRAPSSPIQPLSLVHGNTYADYSHGVRLIGQIMQVGHYKMYVRDVLKDRKLSGMLSDEGAISNSRLQVSQILHKEIKDIHAH